MSLYGNWLVTYFDRQPDLWNVKPPLMIWLQAVSIKIFGYSVGAVRLPSFLAALATVALLYGFAVSSLRNWRAGVLACAVLITTGGYVQWHVTRTGDYDALLILFQMAQLAFFFRYAEHQRARDWWAFVAAIILAIMTKGVVGLAPLPAIAAYAAYTGMLSPLLRSGRFYGGVILSLLLVAGYYLSREAATPSYLASVWNSEIADRLLMPLNGESKAWHYYLVQMVTFDFVPWFVAIPISAFLVWRRGQPAERRALILMLSFSVSWLLVISAAETKLFWYDAPIYPPLALVVGIGLANGWSLIKSRSWPLLRLPAASLGLFALLFAWPLWAQIGKVQREGIEGSGYRFHLLYLGRIAKSPMRTAEVTLLVRQPRLGHKLLFDNSDTPSLTANPNPNPSPSPSPSPSPNSKPKPDWSGGRPDRPYSPSFIFHRLAYAAEHGLRLRLRTMAEMGDIQPGELVAVCDPDIAAALVSSRRTATVDQDGRCSLLKVQGERPMPAAPLANR
jgi:hypothetical protein